MATTLRSVIRTLIPFPVRVAVVRMKDMRKFRAEAGRFSTEKATLEAFPHVFAEHRSPLRRPGTTYDKVLQEGKEANVALVSQFISGVVLAPGVEFSYHHTVGKPTPSRGFVNGAEIHDGELKPGIGGGACQVSNLLFVLALLSGARVTQRYRHGLDLFPDSERTVPFGCGATVFFPAKDLRFRNELDVPVLIQLSIEDGYLVGRTRTQEPIGKTWRIYEAEGSFTKEGDRWIRRNVVARVCIENGVDSAPEIVTENVATCLYDPAPSAEEPN